MTFNRKSCSSRIQALRSHNVSSINNKPKQAAFRISYEVKRTTMNSVVSFSPTLNSIALVIKSILDI